MLFFFFFFNDTATTEIYTLSLHDALPIWKAHYYFTVKNNQANLLADISFYFQSNKSDPEVVDIAPGEHGRIETRKIWTTSELNAYLNFPYVGQEIGRASCRERV